MTTPTRYALPLLVLALSPAVRAQCQVDQFQPHDSAVQDFFGQSLALDGDRLIVGATNELTGTLAELLLPDLHGAVYAFERGAAGWEEAQALAPSISHPLDQFGLAVDLQGRLAAIGAPGSQGRGAVFLFQLTAAGWVEAAVLQPGDAAPGQRFGRSVALSGKRLIVGAPGDSEFVTGAGAVYVFEQHGAKWSEVQKLHERHPAASAAFGASCDLDAERLVVGATSFAFGPPGRAIVFELGPTGWQQSAQLAPAPGPTLSWADDVVLAGDTLLVAGGAVEVATVFRYDGETWHGTPLLPLGPAGPGDRVAMSGDHAVVGTRGASDLATLAGTLHLYERRASGWSLVARLDAPTVLTAEMYGSALALHGDELLVGGPFHEVVQGPELGGSVHVWSLGELCSD